MSALVRVTPQEHGVVTISLDRPDVRNALSGQLLEELTSAFESGAQRSDLRLVVLAGEGKDFCAGADLGDMKALGAATRDANRADARRLGRAFQVIHECPRPVVARVQGNVFGGGVGLVAACDIAIVAKGVRFAFSEVRLGILPAVISPYVVHRIGDANARRLFLTGERFDAVRAREIGLASEVVDDDRLDEAVAAATRDLLSGSPDAQRRIKRLLDAIETGTVREAAEMTPDFIADARASEEGQEGLSAFFEKRKASWVPRGDE